MAEAESNQLLCETDGCQKDAVKFCKNCETGFCSTHVQANELTKSDMMTVEEFRSERDEDHPFCTPLYLRKSQCTECRLDNRFMKDCSLTLIGDTAMLPVSSQTETSEQPLCGKQADGTPAVRIPTNLELKHQIDVPSPSLCVQYSQTGSLLHSGEYELSGLKFTPPLRVGEIISLYEHNSLLYVLQIFDGSYHVHVIIAKYNLVIRSVITFQSGEYLQQMCVTEKYVLIADYDLSAIKVYSTTTYNHIFDIHDTTIFSYPYSLAGLDDTLIVGECEDDNVINMTISQTPEVKWKKSVGNRPYAAIEVKESLQIILVGSSKLISILSYQGEKLKTFDTPQCSWYFDLSSYENQIAVADGTKKIKVYEMKFE